MVEAGGADRPAGPLLVAVHLGHIDAAVADLEGLTDRLNGVLGLDLEDPEAELRDGAAVVKGMRGTALMVI